MKQLKKLAALVLAVTMAATAAVPAWATEGENNKNNGGTKSESTAASEPDNSGTIYISSYNVIYEDPNVSPILKFKDGELKNQAVAKTVTLKVVDTRGIPTTTKKNSDGKDIQVVNTETVNVQINGRNFSIGSGGEMKVDPINGQDKAYLITISNLEYHGSGDKATDDNTLRLDVSYDKDLNQSQEKKDTEKRKMLPLATIEQKLSQFVTQTETTPPAPDPTPEPTPTPDPTYRTPSLIVRSTSIGGSSVDAGDDFKLSLEIYATSSGTEALCDVLVSISTADGVTLSNGSTTKYIGDMAPGTSQTVTYPMHAQNSFTGGTSSVSVSLSANGKTTGGGAQATGTTVTVPIIQPERFEISNMEIPETMVVGEENYGSITFVNKGKNELSNMTVTIAGSNLQEPEQSNYVGNLAAGTEQSVDINLCALQAGTVEGTITIVYEDTSGQEVSVTRNFSATVEDAPTWDDPGMIDPGMQDMPEETKPGLPVWGWALIAAAVAALGFAGFKVAKKRKAAKSQEENDADF